MAQVQNLPWSDKEPGVDFSVKRLNSTCREVMEKGMPSYWALTVLDARSFGGHRCSPAF